ncbi:MAG: hypothetical protein QOI76_1357 [Frankiales bacterium]|nr:hypothetical protein [Frankiales bacterium]
MMTGTAALTAVAVCLGGATPAFAAGRAKPAKLKAVKDPLASLRSKALSDLTVYGKRLSVVLHAGAVSTVLTDAEVGALHDAGVLEGVALRDDRVAVTRAKTKKALAAAVSSGQRTVSVASLQLLLTTAAETHLAAGNTIADAAATLSDEATTAAADGSDTTGITDALDAVTIDLESAQGDESIVVSDVLDLAANATVEQLKAAVTTGNDDVALVDQDVSDATTDLATAQAAFDDLPPVDGSGGDF